MNSSVAIVIMSATRERLHMAGMLAAVGAVSGSAINVFVSMNALACFLKEAAPTAPAEGQAGELLEQRGPPFSRLFADASELGDTCVYPCSLAMELLGVREDQLEPYFCEPIGLTAFMEKAAGSQVWCL